MGHDTFSPLAAALVNVLCLPAGRLTSTTYSAFLEKLQEFSHVVLSRVPSTSGDQFSPRRCPGGIVFLDFSTSAPSSDVFDTVPFLVNAEPQVLLGIADGASLQSSDLSELIKDLQAQESRFQSVTSSCLMVVDSPAGTPKSDNALLVDSSDEESIHNALATLVGGFLDAMRGSASTWEQGDIKSPRSAPRQTARRFTDMIEQSSSPGAPSSNHRQTPSDSRAGTPTRPETPSQPGTSGAPVVATRSKGRYQILLGNLNLQCGVWPDALRHLSEGATIARANSDLIWQAQSLESMVICMVLCTWAGVEFNIPQICFASNSRIQGMSPYESQPSGIAVGSYNSNLKNLSPVQQLSQLISPLVSTIMSLNSNASTIAGDSLPEIMVCETRIRLLDLLVAVQGGKGLLDRDILGRLVAVNSRSTTDLETEQAAPTTSYKSDFAGRLSDAVIQHENRLSPQDRIRVLVAVCRGLARLGADRKRGFYMHELLQKLLPLLVEARKVGAAEAGIHPAAGMSVINSGINTNDQISGSGVRKLLDIASGVFGLSTTANEDPIRAADVEQVQQRLQQWWFDRTEGDIALKIDILRLCIGISEALPDLPAELYFRSRLLRISRPSVRVSMADPETPSISSEEQGRSVSAIRRTVTAGLKFGVPILRAQYWDDFLIQDIRPAEPENGSNLLPHTAMDLSVATDDKSRDPFIFNPFAKPKDSATTPLLVAGELASFLVKLQNPLEVEVEVESISLLASLDGFTASSHSIVLAPLCSHEFVLDGRPTSSGELAITGCNATIRDCRTQRFLIFRDEWRMPQIVKQRSRKTSKDLSTQITSPASSNLLVKVIDPQPLLSITSSSLLRSSVMLLEGESQTITITIRNSSNVPANLVLFTFEDSVTRRLQEALGNKELTPVEVHEIQYQLASSPAVRVLHDEDNGHDYSIEARGEKSFAFEICGKGGLMEAIVLIDFAYLSQPRSEIKGTFYTRQIKYPIKVTVNGTFDIPRCNVLPLGSSFIHQMQHLDTVDNPNGDSLGDIVPALSSLSLNAPDGYCILLLDLLNLWPHPLSITLTSLVDQASPTNSHEATSTIQPGHITRLPILIRRLFIPSPFSPIPYLGPTHRQFVVTPSTLPIQAETAQREAFWYREELLKVFSGTWSSIPSPNSTRPRSGTLDLRKAIRLSSRMIDSLRVDSVRISFSLVPSSSTPQNNSTSNTGVSQAKVLTDTFLTLHTSISNHAPRPLLLLLRIQPSLLNQPPPIALDLSKRLMISGVTQRTIHPAIHPGDTRTVQTGLVVLAEGNYSVTASAEEIRTPSRKVKKDSEGDGLGEGRGERRIWYAREPLRIDAKLNPEFDPFSDNTGG